MNRLVVLVLFLVAIKNASAECFDDKPVINADSPVCIPGHWNIARVPSASRTITATSTCGNPPATACRLKPLNGCTKCNNSNPDESHPPEYIVDKPNGGITFWQSDTWWIWHETHPNQPLQVNITLNFNKSFDATGLLTLTFESPRPFAMILEKSSDGGATWTVLQYYASDCNRRFAMNSTDPTEFRPNDVTAYCTSKYSKISPQKNGEVLFDFKTRYEEEGGFWRADIQKYLHTTNLRFRLLYPGTDGMENGGKTEDILSRLYYAISDLVIIGRCRCNGHAKYCTYNGNVGCGDCEHFTTGVDCEKCLPLYNNRTWMPATSKYQPNPCQKCQCYNHADSCVYNGKLGFGDCQDCKHNTTGHFCEQCKDQFYRNVSLALNHPDICPACNCFQEGILNNGSCHVTSGQCECRQNVTGRQCDRCVDTYYGYTVVPAGHCKACRCVQFGTNNGSLNCHQVSGKCYCKRNIDQRTCSKCKDGFYKFPTTIQNDCLQCDCDYGGSTKEICNKVNGNCQCRKNIKGTRCTVVPPGFFTGSFTYFKLEAEQASGTYTYTANTKDLNTHFTGTGYGKITPPQYINFKLKSTSKFNAYYPLVRYTHTSPSDISLQLEVTAPPHLTCSGFSQKYQITGLKAGLGKAWRARTPMVLCEGQENTFKLTFSGNAAANSSIEIDSLILLPDIKNTKIYQVAETAEGSAHGFDVNTIVSCWNNWTTLALASQSEAICKNISFSAMAQVLDGALPCGCNSIGSVPNTTCNRHGGQCQCKPGVTGRSCDRCMPGYSNFASNGCTACDCNSIGSHHLVCNAITGQCPCKPGVVTRTCGRCNDTYYGFKTGNGCRECRCNASGSVHLQCDGVTGTCPCKNSTTGPKCDQCNHGYYNYTSTGCQACECDKAGSSNLQCHLQTGNCTCKANVQGFKCSQCKAGYFNRDTNNPTGCTPCYCYSRSNTCRSAQGFVKSFIVSYPGKDNWPADNVVGINNLVKKDGNLTFDYNANKTISLQLPDSFNGVHVNSYSELLTLELQYKSVSSVDVEWSIALKPAKGLPTLEFLVKPKPSINITRYHVRLHEDYSKNNITAKKLQNSLANILHIKLNGKFKSSGSMTIKNAKLYTAKEGSVGEYAGNVENCTCVLSNYTGLSCERCNQDYTRYPNTKIVSKPPRFSDRCDLCSCTNRSKSCDGETGRCKDCRTGSEGFFCDRCQQGVDNKTDCTQCLPEYFGLYHPNSNGCKPCKCLLSNTLYGNQTVCNFDNGQCLCKANISGRICDRCHENAYNNSKGHCKDCPECYRLLQVFVHQLRTNIAELEASMNHVRNGGSGDLTFETKLAKAVINVRSLVLKADNSSGIEKKLHKELQNLNKTLDNMELLLRDTVTSDVTTLEGVAQGIARDRNRTSELIQLTHTMVSEGYRLLNATIKFLVSQASESNLYLQQKIPMFSTLAKEAVDHATRQNTTGKDIIDKTLTAGTLVRDANSTSLQTVLDHKKNTDIINKLLEKAKSIINLGIQTNNTAYMLLTNSTTVLENAKSALQSINALNPNINAELQQILSTAKILSDNATAAIVAINNLNQKYSTLTSDVNAAMRQTADYMTEVAKISQDATAMLNEARRAEAEARSAVKSAAQTHKDAKEMLDILQTFAKKANESQQLAALALEKSKEANQTSHEAIAYSQRVNASIQATLRIANQGLAIATTARDLAKKENQDVSAIHSQAMNLQSDVDSSKHTPENFAKIKTNTSNIVAQIEQPINACEKNYTMYAKDAKEKSNRAIKDALNASNNINNAEKSVQKVMGEVSKLQHVDATRLRELQSEIKRLRTAFEQKDVKHLNQQLSAGKQEQRTFINTYKLQVQELRRQVNEMKELRQSLSSVAYRGCT